jgi:hypothetical protein
MSIYVYGLLYPGRRKHGAFPPLSIYAWASFMLVNATGTSLSSVWPCAI